MITIDNRSMPKHNLWFALFIYKAHTITTLKNVDRPLFLTPSRRKQKRRRVKNVARTLDVVVFAL